MLSSIKNTLQKTIGTLATKGAKARHESEMLLMGRLLCCSNLEVAPNGSIHDVEFRVFSQFGDDGIIQWLIKAIGVKQKSFIEFGVEDYVESNTRFLLMNNNWSGMVIDGSPTNVEKILASNLMWRHELYAKASFIDKDNINKLLSDHPFGRELGILSIDIDGNDYWVWDAINVVSPAITIVEYNSVFGCDRAITVPYRADFQRTKAHASNLFYGASLPALYDLAVSKGYTFIGCNSAGNNAYFIRNDMLGPNVKAVTLEEGYVESKLREGRDSQGMLTFATGARRIEMLRGLTVWNTRSNCLEPI